MHNHAPQKSSVNLGIRRAWKAHDLFWPAAYAGILIYFLFVDVHSRLIWTDEALSLFQVNQKSLGEMLSSLTSGVNAIPYLYFLALWVVDQVFTLSPFSLRATSTLFSIFAVILLHSIIKDRFGTIISVISCSLPVALGSAALKYSSEGRPYSLYVFASVFGIWACLRILRREPSKSGYLVIILSAIFLPSAHYVGLLYTVALAAITLSVRWRYTGALDYKLLISFISGWIIFIILHWPQLAIFINGEGLINANWMADPNFMHLLNTYRRWGVLALIIIGTAWLTFVTWRYTSKDGRPLLSDNIQPFFNAPLTKDQAINTQLFLVAMGWLVVPVIAFIVSMPQIPLPNISLGRYFAPTFVAIALLSAILLNEIRQLYMPQIEKMGETGITAKVLFPVLWIVTSIASGHSINLSTEAPLIREPAQKDEYSRFSNNDLPVITNNMHVFFTYNMYASDRNALRLMRTEQKEVGKLKIFNSALGGISLKDLPTVEAFVFVHKKGSVNHMPDFDIHRWADA